MFEENEEYEGDGMGEDEEEEEYKPGPAAHQVPFIDICKVFEEIMKSSKKKTEIFQNFLNCWRETGDKDFFPAMRLFLPNLDRKRVAYGIKESKLANIYFEILVIPKSSKDRNKLTNWRQTKDVEDDRGDFAAVAGKVLKFRCPETPSLSIAIIDEYLSKVADANDRRSASDKTEALGFLMKKLTAFEQKWLIRIIMKDLKIGFNEKMLFKCFHPDANDLYNVCNDLLKVCVTLHSLDCVLPDKDIKLFSAFKPMLGDTKKLSEIGKFISNQEYMFVETKYDGDRIILHYENNRFEYWTRNAHNFTSTYDEKVTQHIKDCIGSKNYPVKSCILDGEMIGYDPETDQLIPKSFADVKTLGENNGKYTKRPCFMVFDIVFLNGKNVAKFPLVKRLEFLRKAVTAKKGRLEITEQTKITTQTELMNLLNDAIDDREEGLMIKDPESIYVPNLRRKSPWIKVKPEYVDSLSDCLDLLIVGGYFGTGRRKKMISHFMLGVLANKGNNSEKDDGTYQGPVFHSFCKVGSGYSDKELRKLGEKMVWIDYSVSNPPPCLILAPGFKEKPDVFIDPTKSQMVTIKAAEITPTEKFKAGYTLRFPRLESFRDDKDWTEALRTDEVENTFLKHGGRLTSKLVQNCDFDQNGNGAPKKGFTPIKMMTRFKATDVSEVKKESDMFENLEFCILAKNKNNLEKLIVKHNGTLTQNFRKNKTNYVVADTVDNARVKSIVKVGTTDILKKAWLEESVEAGHLLAFTPQHIIFASEKTKIFMSKSFDKYGDSYTECLKDKEQLKKIFSSISENDIQANTADIAELEDEYMDMDGEECSLSVFRRCHFYVDIYEFGSVGNGQGNLNTFIKNNPLEITAVQLELHGGKLTSNIKNLKITHVICGLNDLSRLPVIDNENRNRLRKFHVVNKTWVESCIKANKICKEREFPVRKS